MGHIVEIGFLSHIRRIIKNRCDVPEYLATVEGQSFDFVLHIAGAVHKPKVCLVHGIEKPVPPEFLR